MKRIIWLFLMVIFLLPIQSHAKIKTFVESYTYDAGEADSKLTCRALSLLEAKRLLLEKLGTYIKSESKVVNFELTQDEITSLSAGVVKTEIIDEKWDGATYTLTARIQVDPEEVAKEVQKLSQSQSGSDDIKKMEEMNSQSLEKIADLKAELAQVQNNLVNLTSDYSKNAQIVNAWNAFERGVEEMVTQNFAAALEAFDQAVSLNPTFLAYMNRGITHYHLKQYTKAEKDFSTVIQMKSEFSGAYFQRGRALQKMGRKKEGLKDIVKAAKIGNGSARRWLKSKGIRPPKR